jgi:hypothetical protein
MISENTKLLRNLRYFNTWILGQILDCILTTYFIQLCYFNGVKKCYFSR